MKKKMVNSERIEGRIYQHDLVVKQVQNADSKNFGKDFISGTLEVAVDDEGLNVIPVHYTYVTGVTSAGKTNATFTTLLKIINENKTWMTVGKENATMVRCEPSLSLNEFYNNEDNLISVKTNEGGFIRIIPTLSEKISDRSFFKVDMLINRVSEIEPDEEKGRKGGVAVGGAVFDFKGSLLPVEFSVCEAGQKYFLDLDASPNNPVFTQVWGRINCSSETVTRTEESAFGEAAVSSYEKKTKEWLITGARTESYEFGDEDTITVDDVKKAMQDRETHLATVKKNQEEWKAKKSADGASNAASPAAVAAKIPNNGEFKF